MIYAKDGKRDVIYFDSHDTVHHDEGIDELIQTDLKCPVGCVPEHEMTGRRSLLFGNFKPVPLPDPFVTPDEVPPPEVPACPAGCVAK